MDAAAHVVHHAGMLPKAPDERGRHVTLRRGLPTFSEYERIGYTLWCKEAKAAALVADQKRTEELKASGRASGLVLTENGLEIPPGPLNPRIIEHETTLPSPYEQAREAAIQRYVAAVADDHEHEHAVKAADMWEFQRMYRAWELPIRFYYAVDG